MGIVKENLYALMPFIPKMNLWLGTKFYSVRVKLKKTNIKRELAKITNIYANIGCGDAGLGEDWINVDFGRYANVDYVFDCRKDVPFSNNTVKGLFTEHFFEHIDYNKEVPEFLKSCYRVLQKGGVLRIIVPDAEKYLRGYCAPGWDMLKQTRPLDDDLTDELMGIKYQTKMQLINEVFRQGGEHKYAWDFDTMKLVLADAGFSEIHKMEYQKSHDPKLKIDKEIRRHESLYVEAIK